MLFRLESVGGEDTQPYCSLFLFSIPFTCNQDLPSLDICCTVPDRHIDTVYFECAFSFVVHQDLLLLLCASLRVFCLDVSVVVVVVAELGERLELWVERGVRRRRRRRVRVGQRRHRRLQLVRAGARGVAVRLRRRAGQLNEALKKRGSFLLSL